MTKDVVLVDYETKVRDVCKRWGKRELAVLLRNKVNPWDIHRKGLAFESSA